MTSRFLAVLGLATLLTPGVFAAPQIACDLPEINFGRAGEGEAIEKGFLIRNTGDEDLLISRIIPSCTSCTIINVATNRVAPGRSLSVPVRLNLGGFQGAITKTITVESNDPVTPRFPLTLKGEVVSDIILRPAVLAFGQLVEGVPAEQEVSLKAGEGHVLNVTGVDCAQGIFKPELMVEEAGKSYRIKVRFDGVRFSEDRMLVRGRMADMLVIRTDSAGRPVVKVAIQGLLQPGLRAFPAEFNFPAHSKARTATVILRAAPGKSFKVLKAEWPVEGVTAEISDPMPMGIRILFRGVEVEDSLNGRQVTISTDMPGYEQIRIPLAVKHPPTCRVCNPEKPPQPQSPSPQPVPSP